MPDAQELFISYARKDATEIVVRLRNDLLARGFSVWLDTSRINGGASWSREIENGVERCQVMLALLTEGSFCSEICRAEQLRALRKGKRVIPLLVHPQADRPLYLEHLSYRDFSSATRYSEAFDLLLKDIATGAFIPLPERHRQTYGTVPPLPINLVARPEELDRLRQAVIGDDTRRQIALTALRGMGGIGKSVLAQTLCKDEVVQAAFPDGIIWLNIGRDPGDLVRQMREVGKALDDATERYDTPEASVNRMRSILQNKAVLLVLDDVWEARHVEPFRVEAPRCRTLFTTRDGNIGMSLGAEEVKLGVLKPSQSLELLGQWAGRDDPAFPDIAKRVGYLPLALKLAGARLREGMSGDEWLERFQHVSQMKLGRYAKDPHQNLEACFNISLERLPESDRILYRSLGIFPQGKPVPQGVVLRLWRKIDPQLSDFDCDELLTELARQALLELNTLKGVVLHDLLFDYTRGQLASQEEATHCQLLAAYNPQQRHWYEIQDDGYLFRHLAYHLKQAAGTEELTQLLLDSRWLQAKLVHTDIASLIADYDLLADEPLCLVQGAIRLSAHVLARDKKQLAGQLTGRLLSHPSAEIQGLLCTLGEENSRPRLKALSASLTPPGGPLLLTLEGHTGGVVSVAVTADGRVALTGSDDQTARLWDLSCGVELRTLSGHSGWVLAVAITPDGRHAVTASDDETLRLWDLENGTQLQILTGHAGRVNSLDVAPDGRLVLSASHDRTIKVWDIESRAEYLTLVGHNDGVRAVAVTPDGKRALTASDDHTLKIWDLNSGKELCTMEGHQDRVRALALTPDGKRAVTASADHTVRVWDLVEGREVGPLIDNIRGVTALTVSADGTQVLTASDDGVVRRWNLTNGVAIRTLGNHVGRVNALAATRDGKRVLTASDDEMVKVWDLECPVEVFLPTSHSGRVNAVALTPNGRCVISASWDQTVKVWDTRTGIKLRTLISDIRGVTALAITPDGRKALTGSLDATVIIWDLENGMQLGTLVGHARGVRALAVMPGGMEVLTASADQTVRLWDLNSGEELGTLAGHTGSVVSVAVNADGTRAATASDDQTVRVWDLESWERLHTLVSHTGPITAVTLTPDGKRVLTGSVDRTVKLWDLGTGTELQTFRFHMGAIRAVAVARDGRRVFTASDDQTLKVWDMDCGQVLATFTGDSGLTSCAIAPDCSTIIAADTLGAVHFLQLEEYLA